MKLKQTMYERFLDKGIAREFRGVFSIPSCDVKFVKTSPTDCFIGFTQGYVKDFGGEKIKNDTPFPSYLFGELVGENVYYKGGFLHGKEHGMGVRYQLKDGKVHVFEGLFCEGEEEDGEWCGHSHDSIEPSPGRKRPLITFLHTKKQRTQ